MSAGSCFASIAKELGLLLGLLVVLAPEPELWADGEEADPEALFRDAKRDLEAGRLDAACSKFAASYEQSGVAGALLNWADCEERRGHFRLAQELFSKGVIAVADDTERRAFARERAEALATKQPRLELEVAAGAVSVTVDGEAVSAGVALLLDPGEHVVAAVWAAGARSEQRVSLSAGEARRVRLSPPVEPAVPRRVAPLPQPKAAGEAATLRAAGWISGGAGVAAGLVFGGTAIAVAMECPDRRCNSELEGALIANAVSGAISAAGLVSGALLLGFGYAERETPALALDFGPDNLVVVGRFRF